MSDRGSLSERGWVALIVAASVGLGSLVAACGEGDDPDTAEPVTATDPVTASVTPAPTATESTTASVTPAPTVAGSSDEGASGSGCEPGSDDTVPDGRWFGVIEEANETDLAFDLACWFSGEAAAVAAAEDGDESPPPNDYHIRNRSDRIRTVPVDPDAVVVWLPQPGDPATVETIDHPAWLDLREARPFQPGVWLTVEGGTVIEIEEQYVP